MLPRLLLPLAAAAQQQQQQLLLPLFLQQQQQLSPAISMQLQQQQQQQQQWPSPTCSVRHLHSIFQHSSGLLPPASRSCWPCAPGAAGLLQQPHHLQPHQLQQHAAYAQQRKLNPKEQKRQNKTDKRALKKSAVPQSAATSSDSAASFSEAVEAIEPDVTRLVLQAIHNVTPVLDVRAIRGGTSVTYVPGLMPPRKARSLALRWLVKAADARAKGARASYAECLALELLLAYQKRGGARQKRDDLHRLALQNRANVHQRWW